MLLKIAITVSAKPHILIDATFDTAEQEFLSHNGFVFLKVFRNSKHYETYFVQDVECERRQCGNDGSDCHPRRLSKKLDHSSFAAPPIIIGLYFHQILDVDKRVNGYKFRVTFKNLNRVRWIIVQSNFCSFMCVLCSVKLFILLWM